MDILKKNIPQNNHVPIGALLINEQGPHWENFEFLMEDNKLNIGIQILKANTWQAGEVIRDIQTLKKYSYTLKSLGLKLPHLLVFVLALVGNSIVVITLLLRSYFKKNVLNR
jgi:hypothetical protein